jgi:hypothetical protein
MRNRDRLKEWFKIIRPQHKIFPILLPVQSPPIEWPAGRGDLLQRVAIFRNAHNNRLFQALAKNSAGFMKKERGYVKGESSGADSRAANLHNRAWRRARSLEQSAADRRRDCRGHEKATKIQQVS